MITVMTAVPAMSSLRFTVDLLSHMVVPFTYCRRRRVAIPSRRWKPPGVVSIRRSIG